MKKVSRFAFGAVMVILVFALVACTRTAQDYIDAHDADALQAVKDTARASGMEATITAEGDTVIYTYRYLEPVADVEATKAALEGQTSTLRSVANLALTEMRNFGVESPVIRYVYRNSDGSEIWQVEFS
jgi:hypothetical protein